jgi:Uma2 family endonuclease
MSQSAAEPRRHRLTVADYYRMGEVGILAPDSRVELIEGEIIDMAPPGDPHAGTVDQLALVFGHAVAGRAHVRVQNPLKLGEHSEPQPDIALLKPRADFYKSRRPRAADALLVVEVADTSLRFDRDDKIPLYARHGIPEAWLVDLKGKCLVRHRNPQQGAYTLVDEPNLGSLLELVALPESRLDLGTLFD